MNNKFLIILILLLLNCVCVNAENKNDLRTLFLNNDAVICGINIRNFNSKDLNGNDLIDEGEERGNFINAIERLDELKEQGINTLHVLPITPVGKLKAMGTAGSLYAASSFWAVNTQLIDKTSELSPIDQAALFVNECHKRGIRVIADLPSCGSYDLFLTHPELFVKDEKQCSVVPTDWTDVRLFNTGNDEKLNNDVLQAHIAYVDLVSLIGFDGIRADVATIKPYKFWVEIIKYARDKNPEFMFLAEASDSWREPPSKYAEFTSYDKLLEAGFDGYYGSFFNLKEWSAKDFIEHINFNRKLLSSYHDKKSVIMSFTTHDEVSPVLLHGENFSKMICWLEATLPFNPYIIDGFQSGDNYLYKWENKKAQNSETDDDYYFVHRGKLDIFNYSRKPEGNNSDIKNEFIKALNFRSDNSAIIKNGSFDAINTNNKNVFAYKRILNNKSIVVIGNLNFLQKESVKIKYSKLSQYNIDIIKGNIHKFGNYIMADLEPADIIVIELTGKARRK